MTLDERRRAERHDRGSIVVIDDDPEILAALRALFELEDYRCETYDSALVYLQGLTDQPDRCPGPCCILCDVRLPQVDGLELQQRLARYDEIPILLMSGASGAPEAVSAFRAGAVDFLIKPLDDKTLLDAVAKALAVSAERQHQRARRCELAARLATLTRREHEVARRVAQGVRNLQIAEALGIGLRTVKRHRHHAMEKLEVETVVDLVRLFDASSDFGSGDE
jgi:FixJ family two-component response regulator